MLVKQPNGLYCLYDGIYNVPQKWNVTKEQYIRMVLKKARKGALIDLKYAQDIQIVYDRFTPDDNCMSDDCMSEEQFDQFLKEIGSNEPMRVFINMIHGVLGMKFKRKDTIL